MSSIFESLQSFDQSLFVYIKCAPYEKPDKACFSKVFNSLTKSGMNIIRGKFRLSAENN